MYARGSPSYEPNPDESNDDQEGMFRKKVLNLWQEQCLVDVSLACEDKILPAHKLVLSAYSDYFKDLFVSMTSNNQYPVIFMNDVPSDVIQAILEFMYCGEVNIAQYNLNHFMKTARILKVKGLNIDGNADDSQEEYPAQKRHSSMSDKHMSPPRKRMRSQKHYEHEFEGEEESHDSYQAYNAPVGNKRRRSSSMSRESMKQNRPSLTRENMKQHRPSSNSSMVHEQKSFQASSNPAVAAMTHEMNTLHTRKKVKDSRPSQARSVPPPQPALAISQVQENISNFDSSETDPNEDFEDENSVDPNAQLFNFSRKGLYQKDDLVNALASIERGMSLREASSIFGIPYRTLGSKLRESKLRESLLMKQKGEHDSNMSREHEEKLVKFIDYMSQITPLTCNQVRLFAWGIDSVLGGNVFSPEGPNKKWWNLLKRANPKINKVLRSYDFLKSSRLKPDSFSFKALVDYLIPIQEIIEAFDLNDKPENVWSCSDYSVDLNSSEVCVFPSRERFITNSASEGSFASIMFTGSAAGKKISPFIVFKDSVPKDEFTKSGPSTAMYQKSRSGFMDSDLMAKWFEHTFLPQCPKNRSEDNPVILLLNSSFPLASAQMLDRALAENVILLSLMPHLHHACQPMDLPFVQGFRKFLRKNLEREALEGEALKNLIPALMKEPFEKGVTADEIKRGFHACGVFPLMVSLNQKEYLNLRSELDFNAFRSNLKEESIENDKLSKTQSRKMKMMQEQDMQSSSDEEEEQFQDTNGCYVCGKDVPKEGTKDADKWAKCAKRHCKNISCDECLPLNYDRKSDYTCIDCTR